jgi:hypothetical protein
LLVGVSLGLGVLASSNWRQAEGAPNPAVLHQPVASCSGGSASISFSWLPTPGSHPQWLDISPYDNGFAWGTFTGHRVMPGVDSITLPAINSTSPHFWRLNTLTEGGWVTSQTGIFSPCNAPILLEGPVACQDHHSASIHFRWAPLATSSGQQWFEIDLNGDFVGSDLLRIGPLTATQNDLFLTDFHNYVTYYFRIVHSDGASSRASTFGGYTPNCAPYVNPEIYGWGATLVVPRLGINAPVGVMDAGADAVLSVPSNGYDVVRYNFPYYPHMSSAPGAGGTFMIGGHVDYHVIGRAVFWPLKEAQVGDIIEYHLADGSKLTYLVDWVADVPFEQNLTPLLETSEEAIILVTCNGVFDRETRNYDLRRLVHAVPLR